MDTERTEEVLRWTKVALKLRLSELTLNVPFPASPQPSHQWDSGQAQDELRKEATWEENTSGTFEPAPDLGLVLGVERSFKGKTQWERRQL